MDAATGLLLLNRGMHFRRLSVITSLAAVSMLALTGCASFTDALQNESSQKFDSTTQLVAEWDKTAPWLPADATEIQTKETTHGDPAVLLSTSASELDPSQCVEMERQSAATFTEDWSPSSFVDTIFACGDWAVIPTEEGWYGWTPNHPDERAASLAAASK